VDFDGIVTVVSNGHDALGAGSKGQTLEEADPRAIMESMDKDWIFKSLITPLLPSVPQRMRTIRQNNISNNSSKIAILG